MPALVTVMEEVLRGDRLAYVERTDLRFQVKGDVPSDCKAAAVAALKEKGFVIVSANYGDPNGRAIRTIVKQPGPARPINTKAPVYQGQSLAPRRR